MTRNLIILGCVLACPLTVHGQDPRVLREVNGIASPEALGSPFALAGLGDVDGDGVPDFVAGAPGWPMPHPTVPGATIAQVGRAGVYSGATGTPLFSVFGTYNLQALGRAVANAGDLDGDGLDDVAIGAPMFGPVVPGGTPPPQQVQLWSTGTRSLLATIQGGAGGFSSGNFGAAIASAGDAGAVVGGVPSPVPDGVPDIFVGAPDGNAASVHSGAGGTSIRVLDAATLNPPAPGSPILLGGDRFGHAVDGGADLNGDGVPDLLAGAPSSALGGVVSAPPNTWTAGAAFLVSGADGSLLRLFVGVPGENLGYAVSFLGDVDGDGVPDLALGAPRAASAGTDSGSVTVRSGATGSILWSADGLQPGDLFGHAVSRAGDVDGDGVEDVLAGAPASDVTGNNTGSATLLSGRDGRRLGVLHGAAPSDLRGRSLAAFGDVDGDGFPEVLVGAPGTDAGGSGTGSVAVVSFGPLLGPCAASTHPAPAGGTWDMIRIDGSAGDFPRRVDVALGQPFTVAFDPPPGAPPVPFYAFAFIGTPSLADAADPGVGIGPVCFLPPLLRPGDPRLFLLANALVPFDPSAAFPVASPAPWSFTVPGFLTPARVAVQAVAIDGTALRRTNAVLLDVR